MCRKERAKGMLWKRLILFGFVLGIIGARNPIEIKADNNQDYYHYLDKNINVKRDWNKIGKSWYYRNNQGLMQLGWEKVSREDYYPNDQTEGPIEKPNEDSIDFDMNTFDLFEFNTEFLALVNQERTSRGVRPLSYRYNLQKGVDSRAVEMRKAGQISHTRPNGESFSTAFNYLRFHSYLFYLGENIATRPLNTETKEDLNKTTIEKDLAKKFYDQYYASPGHYENMIEKNFTGLSVGLAEVNGQLYNVMILSG